MNKVFNEVLAKQNNEFIKAWKASGKKVIGYTCSYIPSEVLLAMDILPVRLRASEAESLEIGDAYFGPYICTFPKSLLQFSGQGEYTFLDGLIITAGCDSMRRLDESLRKVDEDFPGVVPPFRHHFPVPHKRS